MKVSKLIEILKGFDPEKNIWITSEDHATEPWAIAVLDLHQASEFTPPYTIADDPDDVSPKAGDVFIEADL